MSSHINKVAVIGSGVMGAAIAAHIANSGTEVILLDIVPKDAKDRNMLTKGAIERLLKTNPAPLTHKRKAKLITPGNLEDNLDLLRDVDWIIEVIIENLDIKKELYKSINTVRKPKSIVSSNTSTIPLKKLVEDMPIEFKKHFMITHFFNPPRYMRLLELILGDETNADAADIIREFVDINLGKGVVDCKDTPGFIANRIGCYWMVVGVLDAMEMGVTVEEADMVMGRPVGIPSTGVFGLLDLIGIDLMPLIADELSKTLDPEDAFMKKYKEPDLMKKMIGDGYTGRKGKGGFYKMNNIDGKKVKEVINLKSGDYSAASKPALESVAAAKDGLRKLLEHGDIGGKYAKSVLLQVLGYSASLIPEIADDIISVDDAMRMGYAWKFGPFELIDKLGSAETAGPKWLAEELEKEGYEVPEILINAGNNSFYKQEDGKNLYLGVDGKYKEIKVHPYSYMLADKKLGQKPIIKNASASLWDIGDGIVCLEYTSKMNSVDMQTLEMIEQATELVAEKYKGLVIANDADNFCVGANIGVLLFAANTAAWDEISGIIQRGQKAYMGLKYAPFPVVTAVSGMALGGGCEILLHSDAVQAHIETYAGLVEVGVGLIPGWGGCKEMILRNAEERLKEQGAVAKMGRIFSGVSAVKTANTMPAISRAFENIALAKVAKSAEEARDMLILQNSDGITMNRCRLLSDSKAKCLELAEDYHPPEQVTVNLPGKAAKSALNMVIDGFVKSGKATEYDQVVSKALAKVLSGGDTDITKDLSEQDLLNLELEVFMELIKNKGTLDRIDHMLETGKPLRN